MELFKLLLIVVINFTHTAYFCSTGIETPFCIFLMFDRWKKFKNLYKTRERHESREKIVFD